jgi:hypothetical protein
MSRYEIMLLSAILEDELELQNSDAIASPSRSLMLSGRLELSDLCAESLDFQSQNHQIVG